MNIRIFYLKIFSLYFEDQIPDSIIRDIVESEIDMFVAEKKDLLNERKDYSWPMDYDHKSELMNQIKEIIISIIKFKHYIMEGEKRMKLLNGISGFYDSEADTPPQVDGKQFKQLCFDFIYRNGGKVIDFSTPQYPVNFYNAEIKIFDSRLYILLNEHYPYLAFASAVKPRNIEFIDEPVLFEHFCYTYKVISTVELNEPISKISIENNELNSAELKQIAFWKPETVGQILFNYWD